jgi:hypothetical protein
MARKAISFIEEEFRGKGPGWLSARFSSMSRPTLAPRKQRLYKLAIIEQLMHRILQGEFQSLLRTATGAAGLAD